MYPLNCVTEIPHVLHTFKLGAKQAVVIACIHVWPQLGGIIYDKHSDKVATFVMIHLLVLVE